MSSQKKSSRLEGKDLITIGIYTVIYVVIVMLVAMLGFIPIFIPLMAVLCPLIGGIPYMLYVTKAKKFGMTAIMGFLIGLIMVFFGNGYLTMVTGLVGGLLADVILKKADYKSAKSTVLSCGVFSIWVFGNFAPIFLNRESYMVMLTEGYGAEYAATATTKAPMAEWSLTRRLLPLCSSSSSLPPRVSTPRPSRGSCSAGTSPLPASTKQRGAITHTIFPAVTGFGVHPLFSAFWRTNATPACM